MRRGRAARIELRPREYALLEYLLRNPGRVLTKTMILSHVWGYNFDPEHQRRRRAGLAAAREDRPRLRAEAAPHRARRGLRPQGGLMDASDRPVERRDSGCASRRGTRPSSSSARWRSSLLTYALLPRRSRSATARSCSPRCASTRSATSDGGLPALARAVELEQRTGRQERLFVRSCSDASEALFLSMPPSLERVRRRAAGGRGDLWEQAGLCPNRATALLEVRRRGCSDGTILQVGKSTEIRDALLARFRTVLAIVGARDRRRRPRRRRDRDALDAAADPPDRGVRGIIRTGPHRRARAGPAPSAMRSTS